MRTRVALLAVTALLVGASIADAAAWKRITAPNGGSIEQVALLRTLDGGDLHVVWHDRAGPLTADLLHRTISYAGVVRAPIPLLVGWTGFQNAALAATYLLSGNRLYVFFGGQRSTDSSDPFIGLHALTMSLKGAAVSLLSTAMISSGGQAYGSPVAAAWSGHTIVQAWAGTLGTWVHAGFDPATTLFNFQPPLGNYGYDVGLADGDPATMAWYSNASGHLGVYAQSVNSNGSPAGPLMRMPGTSNMNVGMIGRTPIEVAHHPASPGFETTDVYVAYPTGYPALNAVRLWRVGSDSSRVIARTKRTGNTTATLATSNGRIWVAWTNTVGSVPHVFACRSNRAGTVFGAVVDAGRPAKTQSIYRLDASATPTALDLFANAGVGLTPFTATSYTRILPGLTLGASPRRLPRGKSTDVLFQVLDAGDPVAGATVHAGRASGVTNASGKVTLTIPARTRPLRASATARGYVDAAITLRPRRR